jgi:hypothetical protein
MFTLFFSTFHYRPRILASYNNIWFPLWYLSLYKINYHIKIYQKLKHLIQFQTLPIFLDLCRRSLKAKFKSNVDEAYPCLRQFWIETRQEISNTNYTVGCFIHVLISLARLVGIANPMRMLHINYLTKAWQCKISTMLFQLNASNTETFVLLIN